MVPARSIWSPTSFGESTCTPFRMTNPRATRRILGKLEGANRPEAVALGGRQGLIDLDTRNELRLLEEAITLGWQPEGVHRSVYGRVVPRYRLMPPPRLMGMISPVAEWLCQVTGPTESQNPIAMSRALLRPPRQSAATQMAGATINMLPRTNAASPRTTPAVSTRPCGFTQARCMREAAAMNKNEPKPTLSKRTS